MLTQTRQLLTLCALLLTTVGGQARLMAVCRGGQVPPVCMRSLDGVCDQAEIATCRLEQARPRACLQRVDVAVLPRSLAQPTPRPMRGTGAIRAP